MSTVKHYVGYRLLHDAEKTKRGIPQFYFKCDYCSRNRFKATLAEVRKKGRCKCRKEEKQEIEKKGSFIENNAKKVSLIDVKVVRRMARYMPVSAISDRFGVNVEDIMKLL